MMTDLLMRVTSHLPQRPSADDPYFVHVMGTTVAIFVLGLLATSWRSKDAPVTRRAVAWVAIALAVSMLVHGAVTGLELGGPFLTLPPLVLGAGGGAALAMSPASPDRPQSWAFSVMLTIIGGLGSIALWVLIGLATMR
ncbi:MAG: hypothetical protein IT385_08985 [Deltaproteobacteria bacterium]|nr:hypothetical protein [Deltaproteobacteria bacterium]